MPKKPNLPSAGKPSLYLVGSGDGPPTADDILALFRAVTGREPTPEDEAKARAIMAKRTHVFHPTEK